MKYLCNLIQDLLPLYHDGVCSKESIAIIEKHLSECDICKEIYSSLCETDEIIIPSPNADWELKKAASFRIVKKKLSRRQLFVVIIVLALLTAVAFAAVGTMKNSIDVVMYENISVSMIDNSLVARLQGSQAESFDVRRVEMVANDQTNTYLFFCLSESKWDRITTSDEVFSEYVLCYADKNAEQVDFVYYYTGNNVGIESLNTQDFQKVIATSTLLWSK